MVAETAGADLYRWISGARMYKRVRGSSGPAWFPPIASKELISKQQGWDWLSGDDDQCPDLHENSALGDLRGV